MQTILDAGEGPWDSLLPYSYHDGALLVQGTNQQPFGPGSLTVSGFRVFVHLFGSTLPGIVTGTFGFGDHQCPRNVALPHGSPITPRGLNKDGPDEHNGALFLDAVWLAMLQTGHEFFRLYRMIEDAYGTAQHLLDAWVSGSGPHGGAGGVQEFLELRRERPGYLPPRTDPWPGTLPPQFSIPEMDRRYLPRLAARARELGVPDHPYLAILTSGDYAARLALGEMLHGHAHGDHEEEEHAGEQLGPLPQELHLAGLVLVEHEPEEYGVRSTKYEVRGTEEKANKHLNENATRLDGYCVRSTPYCVLGTARTSFGVRTDAASPPFGLEREGQDFVFYPA